MHGENTFVYGKHLFSEHQLDQADLNLVPCRVETGVGCAFINLDDDAPSLRDSIGPLLDRLEAHNTGASCAPNGGTARCCRRTGSWRWKPSWKATM